MSQINTEDCGGQCSPFRLNASSEPEDVFDLMRSVGVNTFRMRMWNNPCADGRCNATQYKYADLQGVLAVAKRVHDAGLTFVLDFHYSDWWADPGHQPKPHAWANYSFAELKSAVRSFSQDTVAALVSQGTPPYAVQIGNEISNGLLWAGDDQDCSDGGKLWCDGKKEPGWDRVGALVAEGIIGTRTACKSCLIAIHTDLGNHIQNHGLPYVKTWYKTLEQSIVADGNLQHFDMIGLSMYPQVSV